MNGATKLAYLLAQELADTEKRAEVCRQELSNCGEECRGTISDAHKRLAASQAELARTLRLLGRLRAVPETAPVFEAWQNGDFR